MSVSSHDHLWQWGRIVSGMSAGVAARQVRGSRRGVRRAAHVDERAAIELDAVDVQHAVTNPAVGVERLWCQGTKAQCQGLVLNTTRSGRPRCACRTCSPHARAALRPACPEAGIRTQCVRAARMPCHACEHSRVAVAGESCRTAVMTLSAFTAKPQDCAVRQPRSVVLKVSLVRAPAELARLGPLRIALSFDARSDILRVRESPSWKPRSLDVVLPSGDDGIFPPGDCAGRLQCPTS